MNCVAFILFGVGIAIGAVAMYFIQKPNSDDVIPQRIMDKLDSIIADIDSTV